MPPSSRDGTRIPKYGKNAGRMDENAPMMATTQRGAGFSKSVDAALRTPFSVLSDHNCGGLVADDMRTGDGSKGPPHVTVSSSPRTHLPRPPFGEDMPQVASFARTGEAASTRAPTPQPLMPVSSPEVCLAAAQPDASVRACGHRFPPRPAASASHESLPALAALHNPTTPVPKVFTASVSSVSSAPAKMESADLVSAMLEAALERSAAGDSDPRRSSAPRLQATLEQFLSQRSRAWPATTALALPTPCFTDNDVTDNDVTDNDDGESIDSALGPAVRLDCSLALSTAPPSESLEASYDVAWLVSDAAVPPPDARSGELQDCLESLESAQRELAEAIAAACGMDAAQAMQAHHAQESEVLGFQSVAAEDVRQVDTDLRILSLVAEHEAAVERLQAELSTLRDECQLLRNAQMGHECSASTDSSAVVTRGRSDAQDRGIVGRAGRVLLPLVAFMLGRMMRS